VIAESLRWASKPDKEEFHPQCQGLQTSVSRLGWYLFRQNLIAFVFATAALTCVVLFTLSFRLLSLVIDNAGTMLMFLQLMGLSLPSFLPVIVPLSLGAATIFIYHKFALDSELTVMRAAGISPLRLALPALGLAALAMLFCLFLTSYLAPLANRMLVTQQYKLKDTYSIFLIRPGVFNDITDGLTFYARRRDKEGGLEDILIHDVRKPDKPVTVMAERGHLTSADGLQQIIVSKGRRQEVDRATGQLSELNFDRYLVDLSILKDSADNRLPDPREQTMFELMSPPKTAAQRRTTLEKIAAEFHQRLAIPLLPLTYAMIGLAAILAGEFNRRGMGKRLVIAAIAIVVMQAVMLWLVNIIARLDWLTPIIYIVPLIPAALAYAMLRGRNFALPRLSSTAPKPVVTA